MQIINRKAKFNYSLEEGKVEAGIVLKGLEAKAVRGKHVDITNSTARIMDGEAYLINANIVDANAKNYNSTRSRKLLLHKKEIIELTSKIKARGLTLVPMRLYNIGRRFKVELALGKSKRKFEKKEAIKKHDIQRDIEKEFGARV